jgi:hypothetical protein
MSSSEGREEAQVRVGHHQRTREDLGVGNVEGEQKPPLLMCMQSVREISQSRGLQWTMPQCVPSLAHESHLT